MAWTKEYFKKKGLEGGLKIKATKPKDYFKKIRKLRKNYKRKPKTNAKEN